MQTTIDVGGEVGKFVGKAVGGTLAAVGGLIYSLFTDKNDRKTY